MWLDSMVMISVFRRDFVNTRPLCRTFGQWYANGSDMCNAMWGDAFSVSSDDSNCINMW